MFVQRNSAPRLLLPKSAARGSQLEIGALRVFDRPRHGVEWNALECIHGFGAGVILRARRCRIDEIPQRIALAARALPESFERGLVAAVKFRIVFELHELIPCEV